MFENCCCISLISGCTSGAISCIVTAGALANTAFSFSIATMPPPIIRSCNSSSLRNTGKSLLDSGSWLALILFCSGMKDVVAIKNGFIMRNKAKSINCVGLILNQTPWTDSNRRKRFCKPLPFPSATGL